MNKKLLLAFTGFFCTLLLHAQVRDGRTTIDTTVRSAVIFDSDLSQDEAEDAIEGYFDSLHIEKEKGKGFIIKKSLGYMLFKRAKVELAGDAFDYYFVVEEKKQKGKDASVVYMAAAKSGTNFFSYDDKAWSELKDFAAFLQSNYFEQHKLYVQLAGTNKDLEKKKKKLEELLKEKSALESGISTDSAQIVNFNESLMKLKAKKQ
ncbi:hypothetical protein I5907_20380 [Panacibacter sp. DH6]|uniref:DUF4468 domain-containing protein n=1 Tax=Panacibacter microcysteis TaxID=2793269 RepID=A0A931H085_9BACT|nr:hypothetical protein [Panacibacter microcysteis]MBG9378601.1 hypothetical protein [Panacibacter microcysteis]